MKKVIPFLAFVFFHSASMACLSIQFEDYILFKELPPSAQQQQVVAKVELINLEKSNQSASVRVVDAIKGTKKGNVIKLVSGSSCGWVSPYHRFGGSGSPPSSGGTYYIAGEWKQTENGTVFSGAWNGDGRRVN